MSPSEQKLIADLYDRYAAQLWHYVIALYPRKPSLADELVSDVFHAAINRVDTLLTHPNPGGWLRRTLHHKLLHYWRTQQFCAACLLPADEEVLEQLPAAPQPRPTEEQAEFLFFTDRDTWVRIKTALTPTEFYVFEHVILHNATHREVAEALGITVWNSQKKLERARNKLAQLFGYPRKDGAGKAAAKRAAVEK